MALCLLGTQSHAALLGRLPATQGGTDYQAYYDTVLNLSWLADANRASTSGFDTDGAMTFPQVQEWIEWLNTINYLGASDWRLPTTPQPDPSCSDQSEWINYGVQNSGTGCVLSEYGHLFNVDHISTASPAPFTNISGQGLSLYWSGTVFAPLVFGINWDFNFVTGEQNVANNALTLYAWTVRPGDIDSDGDGMPEPQDNCTRSANNAGLNVQVDSDGDGYGNICDADINNAGLVTALDFNLLRACINLAGYPSGTATCQASDMNASGTVRALDFNLLRARINTVPGPSGLHPLCPPTCP